MIYILGSMSNPNDFHLPNNTVAVFRSYPWPLQYKLNDNILNMLNIAFKGKGLIRNSSYHCGNFEMIGKRCSKQSTGSMLCLQLDVDKHQYFRETMDLGLLPQVRSIVNILMEEAISTGNSCSCTLNTYYQRQLSMTNEKQLCFHAIITQRNFSIQYTLIKVQFSVINQNILY